MAQEILTQERLKELLHYSIISGKFYWHNNAYRNRQAGKIAGAVANHGYIHICVDSRLYLSHRLAFLYILGRFPHETDHINQCRAANGWINLREVSRQENCRNRSLSAINTSGVCGVSYYRNGIWSAYIKIDRKKKHLGYSKDFDKAVKMRKNAEIKYGFHPNHGRKANV